jgi:mono/diheme cytochrome c family protein
MKKALRILLYVLILAIVVVVGFVLYIQVDGIPKYSIEKVDFPQVQATPDMVAQGLKIASVQCIVCHRGSDNKLSGRLLNEIPPDFGEIHSANITQSKEHGIGNWTDEQIAYLLRTGCKSDGQYIPVYMPKFPHLSDYDLKSVIAFLHSDNPVVQPSEVATVPSKPSFLTKFLSHVAFKKIPYPKETILEPDSNDAVAFGKYLVTGRYDCYPCHSKDFKTLNMEFPDKTEGFCGGGNTMLTPNGNKIFTANITFDEKTGIGTWTEDDFRNAMLLQKNKEGHAIRPPMLPFNGMTDAEIHGVWAYLQSIPKISNTVDRQWDKEDL